jgi:hypothetical protein
VTTKLTGDELLAFSKENAHQGEKYVMEAAGYFQIRRGKMGLLPGEYRRAISEAIGIVMGPTISDKPSNRQPTYKIRSSNRNVIPLSGCYSRMMDLEPGDYVDIEPMDKPDGTTGFFISKAKEELEPTGACAILA